MSFFNAGGSTVSVRAQDEPNDFVDREDVKFHNILALGRGAENSPKMTAVWALVSSVLTGKLLEAAEVFGKVTEIVSPEGVLTVGSALLAGLFVGLLHKASLFNREGRFPYSVLSSREGALLQGNIVKLITQGHKINGFKQLEHPLQAGTAFASCDKVYSREIAPPRIRLHRNSEVSNHNEGYKRSIVYGIENLGMGRRALIRFNDDQFNGFELRVDLDNVGVLGESVLEIRKIDLSQLDASNIQSWTQESCPNAYTLGNADNVQGVNDITGDLSTKPPTYRFLNDIAAVNGVLWEHLNVT